MMRLFALVSSLLFLVGSSYALTVIDTKASSGFTQIRMDIDMGPSGTQRHSCDRRDRMGPSSIATKQSSNACCSDFPYCGCPKLDTTATTKVKKNFRIKLPAVKAQSSNMCCPDFPYCGCPKLDTTATTKVKKNFRIKLPAVKGQSSNMCCPDFPYCGCPKLDTAAKVEKNFRIKLPAVKGQSSNMCCPDFPYCGCPKLDTRPKQPRFQVINVRSSAKRNAKVMALTARPKALVGAGKSSGGCCPDYPLCGCPKL